MLVLVLILVVIALVLLLAGWFLHVVALAWTSVGISLLAGLVLLYDWWQTRSAVRAGDRPDGAAGAGGPDARERAGLEARYGADMEPATQVLPVVRPGSAGGPGGSAAVATTAGDAGNATDATVQMPVVRPSGSSEGPPGVSRSSGSSSPSVTDDVDPAGAGSDAGHPVGVTAGGADGQAGGTGRGGDPDRSGSPSARGTSGPDAGAAPAAGPPGVGPPASPAAAGSTGSGAAGAVAGGAAGAVAAGAATGAGSGSDDPAAAAGTPAGPADHPGAPVSERRTGGPEDAGPVPPEAAGDQHPPGATTAPGSTSAGTAPAGGADRAGADLDGRRDGVVAGADGTAAGTEGAGRPGDTGGSDDVAQPPDGEAPEEPHDPTLAGLVARLPDEVLVIDEHPRYHVPACRTLSGLPVIPLPVSEAVELGFTPCARCSPNRTLGERHPAQVR